MATQPILAMQGVCKQFGGIQALDQAHFDLYQGEIHAIVGENGIRSAVAVPMITGVACV